MELLKSDFNTWVEIFYSARREIILSTPAITEEIAEALIQVRKQGLRITIFLEFSEKTYREGFGDFEAITKLRESNIRFIDKQKFNIYFLITDDTGYFYFPKSLFFEKEGTSYDLFPMAKLQVKKLKLIYNLLDDEDPDYENLVDEIGIENLSDISKGIQPISSEKSIELETKLRNDRPVKITIGRTLEIYKAKFQVVELKFTGANFHVKKVKLPRKALPFKDEKLKKSIEANLRLFTDIPEKEFLKPFFLLKNDLDIIREKFLHYIKSRDKNIIKRTDKECFKEAIKDIVAKIEKLKKDLLNKLQEEIINSRQRLKKNLLVFLLANPPKEFDGLKEKVLENEVKNATNKIISSIKFPKSKDLLETMKIDYHYYDITWEDLNNKEVLEEMQKLNLITENDKAYIEEMAIGAERQ